LQRGGRCPRTKPGTASVSTTEGRTVAHEVVLTETLVETLEQFETEEAERVINKLEDIVNFPDHFLDRLKNHPGYKLRVGDFRVLVDWDKDNEVLYAIDAFERKKEYRELGKYREVWGSWRDDEP
jgi:mRNA interferase RelE/StbE